MDQVLQLVRLAHLAVERIKAHQRSRAESFDRRRETTHALFESSGTPISTLAASCQSSSASCSSASWSFSAETCKAGKRRRACQSRISGTALNRSAARTCSS